MSQVRCIYLPCLETKPHNCQICIIVHRQSLFSHSRACSSYECFILMARRLSSKLLKQGYLVERLKSSFRKFYGRYDPWDLILQYEVSLSRMLNDILTLDQQWLPNQSDFPPISWPWHRLWPSPNYEWFPWSICNGCGMPAGNAYPSGHLVPSPYWDLLMLQLLRPNSSNLPCLYSTFHLEYPLVLSRFCFAHFWNKSSINLHVRYRFMTTPLIKIVQFLNVYWLFQRDSSFIGIFWCQSFTADIWPCHTMDIFS